MKKIKNPEYYIFNVNSSMNISFMCVYSKQ